MNSSLKEKIAKLISIKLGMKIYIENISPLTGGCINECFSIQTSHGKYFVKKNNSKTFPGMFASEAKGIELLNDSVTGIAPEVIVNSDNGDEMILILQWIETGVERKEFWNHFAEKLSSLHHRTSETFGLDHNNYIGSLPQRNIPMSDWNLFFILQRIEPQLKKSIDDKILPLHLHRSFEKIFLRLNNIFPVTIPSLVHGDLWSGNFMIGIDGSLQLIDPSVYFGHREMDLAMTKLFGGFASTFYDAYQNYFPIEKDFEKRADIYNLYPLLTHINLFGGYYINRLFSVIKKFV